MKTKVFVSRIVLDDLLGVFGEEQVREMLSGYQVVIYDDV
jgi:hypothetical protein